MSDNEFINREMVISWPIQNSSEIIGQITYQYWSNEIKQLSTLALNRFPQSYR